MAHSDAIAALFIGGVLLGVGFLVGWRAAIQYWNAVAERNTQKFLREIEQEEAAGACAMEVMALDQPNSPSFPTRLH